MQSIFCKVDAEEIRVFRDLLIVCLLDDCLQATTLVTT